MISKLLPELVNPLGLAGQGLVEVGLDHGDAAHQVLLNDVGELQEALDTPVQNLLVWTLHPLDVLENGDG